MKILKLLFAFIAISTLAKAQITLDTLPEQNGKIIFERTEMPVGKTKAILFAKVKKWMVDYLGSTQAIQSENKKKGQLIGLGHFTSKMKGSFLFSPDYRYDYKMQVDCQKNKYSFRIYNITYTKDINENITPSNPIALESYNAELKKAKNQTAIDNATTLNLKFINIFYALRDRINSRSLYNPTPAEIVLCDLIKKQVRRRYAETNYSTPQNEIIKIDESTSTGSFSRQMTLTMDRSVGEYTDQHIYLTFDDGAVSDFPSYNTWVKKGSNKFLYTAVVNLSNVNTQNLKDKKITKFRISNSEINIEPLLATKVKAWMNYLDSFK